MSPIDLEPRPELLFSSALRPARHGLTLCVMRDLIEPAANEMQPRRVDSI
jgi:hypothetical protein